MKASVPVLISTQGYGLLFDSSCLMTFRDDHMGSYMWFEAADQLDYYFYMPAITQKTK
jgi:alpha-D-xyloside xylohydrolase